MQRCLARMALSAVFFLGSASALHAQINTSISSNFNGTPIAAGNYIWFNSVFDYMGPTGGPVTISFRNSTIEFSANNTFYQLNVPDGEITFDPNAPLATTTFQANTWVTTLPFGLSGNVFLNGLGFQVPVNFPGGINPVVWRGVFYASIPDVCLNWKWAAAVYTNFSDDPNALGVKPVDDNQGSQYPNSDHGGTPENFRGFVIGGARGGGGSNYTGSYSGTDQVCTGPLPVQPLTWGAAKAMYRD